MELPVYDPPLVKLTPAAAPAKPELPPLHVEVRFGKGVPIEVQGPALLAFERHLREIQGVPAEVFKEAIPDDLKRRRDMTPADRKRL